MAPGLRRGHVCWDCVLGDCRCPRPGTAPYGQAQVEPAPREPGTARHRRHQVASCLQRLTARALMAPGRARSDTAGRARRRISARERGAVLSIHATRSDLFMSPVRDAHNRSPLLRERLKNRPWLPNAHLLRARLPRQGRCAEGDAMNDRPNTTVAPWVSPGQARVGDSTPRAPRPARRVSWPDCGQAATRDRALPLGGPATSLPRDAVTHALCRPYPCREMVFSDTSHNGHTCHNGHRSHWGHRRRDVPLMRLRAACAPEGRVA